MSRNAVDAALAVAYRRRQPLMLIPSRRQVEAKAQGGGYVAGWNTETFTEYVRRHDPDGLLLLCRDHGGPYQNPRERAERQSLRQAMDSARRSYEEDIRHGFDLLHIDTSVDLNGVADINTAIDRAIELYGHAVEFAASAGRRPLFEIGFEDQGCDTNDPAEFEEQVTSALTRLRKAGLPKPTFVVAQTATKVVETRNVGALLMAPYAVESTVRELVGTTSRNGIALKAHNCDYLTHENLAHLTRAGIGALNVAPEFGVAETRAFISLLKELGLSVQLEHFLAAAYESRSWQKWMHPQSTATDTECAIIAGHYIFGTQEFKDIKSVAVSRATARGIDLDGKLREAVAASIDHYAAALPHVGHTGDHEMASV